MGLSDTDLDRRGRAAGDDLMRTTATRAEPLTIERLHAQRRRTRTRRHFAGLGVLCLLVLVVALVARPSRDTESIDIVNNSADTPVAAAGSANDVLIVADGIDSTDLGRSMTYVDPTARTATRRLIEEFRRGDQPHQLIESGGRLVVGWGEVYSTTLEGEDAVLLGRAEFAVPAVEDGTVWLIDYPGGSIDTDQGAIASRVGISDGVVVERGQIDPGLYPETGITGGLALSVVDTPGGLMLWRAADPQSTVEIPSGSGINHATAAGDVLAFCPESECQVVRLVDTRVPEEVETLDTADLVAGSTVVPDTLRLSPDGGHLAFVVENPAQPTRSLERAVVVAELNVTPAGIGDIASVISRLDTREATSLVEWSPISEVLYVATRDGAEDEVGDSTLYQLGEDGDITSVEQIRGVLPLEGPTVVVPRSAIQIPPGIADGLDRCDTSVDRGASCTWGGPVVADAESTPTAIPTPDTTAPENQLDVPLVGRYGHTVTWTGSEVVVWGGEETYNSSGPAFGDGAVYDPTSSTWRPMAPAPVEATAEHLAVWADDAVVFVGGHQDPRQVLAYTPADDRWVRFADLPFDVATNMSPSSVTAAWTGDQLVVWSGEDGLAAYDPTQDGWEELGQPPLAQHEAVALHVDTDTDPATLVAVGSRPEDLAGIDVAVRDPDGSWREGPSLDQLIDEDETFVHFPIPRETVLTDAGLLVIPSQGAPIPAALWDLDGDWVELPVPPKPGCEGPPRPIPVDGGAVVGNLCGNAVRFDEATQSFTPFESVGPMGSDQVVWTGEELIGIEPTPGIGSAARSALTSWRMPLELQPADESTIRATEDAGLVPEASPAWTEIAEAPISERFSAAAEWTGEEFFVWGGYDGTEPVNDGATYDPDTDTWQRIPDAPIPGAHEADSFVGLGDVYVVGGFGGDNGRDNSIHAAAWTIENREWRTLPDLPEFPAASAWLSGRAVVVGQSGTLYALPASETGWQALGTAVASPFNTADGDGSILLVDEAGARLAIGLDDNGPITREVSAQLNLSHDAQDQRLDVTLTADSTWIVAGPAGTDIVTLTGSQVAEPLTGRFVALHAVSGGLAASVATQHTGVQLMDVTEPTTPTFSEVRRPDLLGSFGHAIAAGNGRLFVWSGATSGTGPQSGGALLTLHDR